MMNSVFSEEILADKLSKLNSTQQCIETLSHWCIFHRSKAEQVVATWGKQFHSSDMAQQVPLLYLANDILQNSKRNGNEFVTEFWKVLPSALKAVVEKGDDHGKKVVSRLVGIWEERRVFGSRLKSLKEVMLGEELPAPLELGRKRSRSVKIVKRDSRSVRIKLTVGGSAEKIVSAYHLVQGEHASEDEEMNKCKSAVQRLRKMEKDVDSALTRAADPKRKDLAKELEGEEDVLNHCIEKLKVVEANRLALVSQLREALQEQESELEHIRTQIQVAQGQAEEASRKRKQLDDENYVADLKTLSATGPGNPNTNTGQATKKTAAAIAAEVADKLAASSSSQYIMSSVLSTFAAEEAKNAGLTNSATASSSFPMPPISSAKNLTKPEKTLADPSVFMPAQSLNIQPYQSMMVPHASIQGQVPNSPAQYHSLPSQSSQQYMQQASGGLMNSYGYGNVPPLPPGPPPYMMNPMVAQQQVQMHQQQPLAMSHQPPTLGQQQAVQLPQPGPPSFRALAPVQSPGMVYYGHPHQSQ